MVGTALRGSSWMGRHAWPFALAWLCASSAFAQAGPFFEPQALPERGYELRLSLDYHAAVRDDFSRPIFLIAQPLSELSAHELRLSIDLRLSITRALAMQVVLPFAYRSVTALTAGLVVSRTETLPPRELSLSGSGLADPLLALAYSFFVAPPWRAYAELGASIPLDDNPGSTILATRVPSGAGQHVLFAGVGASLAKPIALSLAYRFEYSPGEHATYLIRRAGPQVFTSGALAPFARNRFRAAAGVPLFGPVSFWLFPEWTISQVPLLVELGATRRVQLETWTHELVLGGALRLTLGAHRLELRGSLPLLPSQDLDPFFPIVVPARGLGIAWHIVGS
ncbi:MAG TPA: hypothetical protein VJR89_01825 [Polyangiales bacterium]|nr:hypothetical protein [Polyangiales bacterium]